MKIPQYGLGAKATEAVGDALPKAVAKEVVATSPKEAVATSPKDAPNLSTAKLEAVEVRRVRV